jgi:parallel beta-helix repeat protein
MLMRPIVAVAVLVGSVSLTSHAFADRISGTITRTFVIVEDSDLVGDVNCEVGNATPCLSFGAPSVELRLNGFSITGRGDAQTGCGGASVAGEAGITTSNMSSVAVRGPGLVQRFRGDGITVAGSRDVRIEGLTVSTNCMSGIRVLATSFGTIIGHNSRVRLNAAQGNGYAVPSDDFGIGLVGTPSGNLIEQNTVSGNTNGIYIAAGAVDNVIRENVSLGNPAIQSSNTQPPPAAFDILNLAPAGRTQFERNVCITSQNAPCSGVTPPPQQDQ